MRTLLFLSAKITGPYAGTDRVLQLSTRLVVRNCSKDYCQLVPLGGFAIPSASTLIHGTTDQVATRRGISITRVFDDLTLQIEQADIILGHRIDLHLAAIIATARRADRKDVVAMLTHPRFGFDGGRLAAICIQRLAAEYFQFLGKSSSLTDTKLATIYRQLFQEELVGTHDASTDIVACQRVYNHLRDFQLEYGLEFSTDVVCLDD